MVLNVTLLKIRVIYGSKWYEYSMSIHLQPITPVLLQFRVLVQRLYLYATFWCITHWLYHEVSCQNFLRFQRIYFDSQ